MPREGQSSVTVPTWVWEKAKKFYRDHKEALEQLEPPITSASKLVTYWIEKESSKTRFDHFNTWQDEVIINDRILNQTIKIKVEPNGESTYHFHCPICDSNDCIHIRYLEEEIPHKTIKPLQQKGWYYKPKD